MSPESHVEELSAAEVLFVERQCSRFEDAWKAWRSRPRPSLEEHLADAPERVATVLLGELLHLDLAYRRRHGEQPVLAEYLPRFP